MMRSLFRFHGGVHPPQSKTEASSRPIAIAPIVPKLVVSLRQHAGEAARPIVRVGDRVLKGQMIGAAQGEVSATIHAPTSGIVRAIDLQPVPHRTLTPDLCITIETDGADAAVEFAPLDYRRSDPALLRQRLLDSGVVGMGGAVYPSHIKAVDHGKAIPTLVINAAECEPFITCDDLLMRERAGEVMQGIEILRHMLDAREVLIGIEDNKPQAIAAMRAAASGAATMAVTAVPTLYPVGGAKQLIRVLTGIEIPADRHALDFGVQCFNLGTAYAVYRAIALGEPVISRIVTVAGHVAQPQNYEVRLGTPMAALFALAKEKPGGAGYIMGGPLMGLKLPSKELPVVKATNCILRAPPELSHVRYREMPCIRCGQCALACPMELQPHELYWFAKSDDLDKAQQYALLDCIECGACSYACPSHIPLVTYYRAAKGALREQAQSASEAQAARERYQQRQARLAQGTGEEPANDDSAEGAAAQRKRAAVQAAVASARARHGTSGDR